MYNIVPTGKFKKNLKLAIRRGYDIRLLDRIVTKLANREVLEPKYKDYLNLAKCKKRTAKKIRKAIKAQLQYMYDNKVHKFNRFINHCNERKPLNGGFVCSNFSFTIFKVQTLYIALQKYMHNKSYKKLGIC